MWCNFNGSDCCNSKFISILFYNFRNLVDESSRSNECIFSVSHRSTSCMICLACYSHIISVHTCNRWYNADRCMCFIKSGSLFYMKFDKTVYRLGISFGFHHICTCDSIWFHHFASWLTVNIQLIITDIRVLSTKWTASQKSFSKTESFFIGKHNHLDRVFRNFSMFL